MIMCRETQEPIAVTGSTASDFKYFEKPNPMTEPISDHRMSKKLGSVAYHHCRSCLRLTPYCDRRLLAIAMGTCHRSGTCFEESALLTPYPIIRETISAILPIVAHCGFQVCSIRHDAQGAMLIVPK